VETELLGPAEFVLKNVLDNGWIVECLVVFRPPEPCFVHLLKVRGHVVVLVHVVYVSLLVQDLGPQKCVV